MLQFLDELKEGYAKADKALGGILPGGGTAGPLTPAARAVSEALPIIDMVSPASANYYRDKVEADRQRGVGLATEARQTENEVLEEINDARGNLPSARRTQNAARLQNGRQQANEAALRGVVINPTDPNLPPLSTREYGQSDRDFYLQNQNYRNSDPETADRIGIRVRSEMAANVALGHWNEYGQQDGKPLAQQVTTSKAKGVSWVDTITKSEDLSTAEGPEGGSLGCVYGVNKVIKASGREVPWKDPKSGEESVYIPFVEDWITSNGGQQVPREQAAPGDIVSDGGHMGILTDKVDGYGNPIVLSNSSSSASMSYKYPLNSYHKVYRVPQLQN